MRCHSHECEYSDIVKALGLWSEPISSVGTSVEPLAYHSDWYEDGDATVYQYLDESRKELYRKVRRADKKFIQLHVNGAGETVSSLEGIRKVPFGLPELIAPQNRFAVVYIAEGEKDAIRLRDNGFLAVHLEDNALTEANLKLFKSRHIVITEDNDAPGRAKAVKRADWSLPVAASVKVMQFTELQEKGDVSDWWDAGGTREEFCRRAEQLPLYGGNTDQHEWDVPEPLQATHGPALDPSLLPVRLRDYCEAMAASHQSPLDMVATTALGAISAAVAGRYTIYRWNEPVHAMCVSVARPGLKKSALMFAMTEPLLRWQAERQERDRLEIADWESTERTLTKARDRMEGEPRKGEDQGANRDLQRRAAVRELHEHQNEKPVLTTLVVDDATPQAVAWHLIEQPSIAVVSAESAYLENFYRYGDTPDFNAFLQGHAADPLHVHRRSGQSGYTERACLTLCMAIQPHAVKRMGGVDGFLQRGGAARLLMALPKDNAGSRLTGRKVPIMPESLKEWWDKSLRALLDARHPNMSPVGLKLTQEAMAAAETFEEVVEDRYRFLGDNDAMRGWMSKQVGAALRIAALLHLVSHDASVPVDHITVGRGIALSEWYRAHAAVAFTMMDDSGDDYARIVWSALLEDGGVPVSRRDLHIKLRGQVAFKKAADLDSPLSILESYGYIRIRKVTGDQGGRPTEWIDLNPLALPAKTSVISRATILEMYKPNLRATGTESPAPRVMEEI